MPIFSFIIENSFFLTSSIRSYKNFYIHIIRLWLTWFRFDSWEPWVYRDAGQVPETLGKVGCLLDGVCVGVHLRLLARSSLRSGLTGDVLGVTLVRMYDSLVRIRIQRRVARWWIRFVTLPTCLPFGGTWLSVRRLSNGALVVVLICDVSVTVFRDGHGLCNSLYITDYCLHNLKGNAVFPSFLLTRKLVWKFRCLYIIY